MRKILTLIIMFVSIVFSGNMAFADDQQEALKFFKTYVNAANSYSTSVENMYAPDAKIIRQVVKPDGELVDVETDTNTYIKQMKLGRTGARLKNYKNHYSDIKYLDTLFINASKAVIKKGNRTSSALTGISAMTDAGVITVPEYWKNNYWRVKWLPELLAKLGGSV